MSKIINDGKCGIIYTIDLSAAFDLLKPDIFAELFKGKMSEGLFYCIIDFLLQRKFIVEVGEASSEIKTLDRGCVQGSILGPKLFTLYTHQLSEILQGVEVISYADDTYVIVSGDNYQSIIDKVKHTLLSHINFLSSIGMVVNEDKTEIMWIGRKPDIDHLVVNKQKLTFVTSLKALGIYISGDLNWDVQAEYALRKGVKLISMFKFMRKYLTESQFLKAASAHFYGSLLCMFCLV